VLLPLAALIGCAGASRTTVRSPPAPPQAAARPEAAPGRLAAADDPGTSLARALALERQGRDAEAIAELERLRAADPGQAGVRARLAERYEAMGRLEEAEAELRGLAEATPGRPEGWRRLAAYCARTGQFEKAHAAEVRVTEAEARPRRQLRPLLPTGR
jgi:predicted Zn-dependent protease